MRFLSIVAAAMLAGGAVGAWPVISSRLASSPGEPLGSCRAVDGDTLRCGEERVRLLGIDAPELPGHCRASRRCAPGDPIASTASLSSDLMRELRIMRVGEDRYGRTLAIVEADRRNLSCKQLARGAAIYRADWDTGGRVAAACPMEAK